MKTLLLITIVPTWLSVGGLVYMLAVRAWGRRNLDCPVLVVAVIWPFFAVALLVRLVGELSKRVDAFFVESAPAEADKLARPAPIPPSDGDVLQPWLDAGL